MALIMSPNMRIALNFVATYGRSLYTTICGLFTVRWVLIALGVEDYGLIGVVGGIIGFITFFNSLLSSSVSRFYAYYVGRSVSSEKGGIDEIRRWFNVAVTLHTGIAIVSIIVGWLIGEWAIRNFLTIPTARVTESIWVFRFACLSCFISMISVPCVAMYTAKQEIAELTIYGFASATLNIGVVYYMMSHPRDWFVFYGGWMAFLSVAQFLIMSVRAFIKYPECRIVPKYMLLKYEMKELVRYAGLRALSSVTTMLTFNGMSILVNKMLGPVRNAAATLGNRIASHALTLTYALTGALGPAITNAAGAKDFKRMESLSKNGDICSTFCVAVFAIPLILEMDTVLHLWLKTVPEGTGLLCQLILLSKIIDQMTVGEYLSLVAHRNIAAFQIFDCLMYLIPFSCATIVFVFGGDIWGIGLGFIIMYLVDNIGKLFFANKMYGFKIWRWVLEIFLPLIGVLGISFCIAYCSARMFDAGILRVVVTTAISDGFLVAISWKLLLPKEIKEKIKGFVARRRRKSLMAVH